MVLEKLSKKNIFLYLVVKRKKVKEKSEINEKISGRNLQRGITVYHGKLCQIRQIKYQNIFKLLTISFTGRC